jgi:hypothetical protein
MASSTSSKASVRILSSLLILALLYIIFVPAHPSRTSLSPPTDHDRQPSWYDSHISTSKHAGDSTHAASEDIDSDAVQEETEQEDDSERPNDIGDHIAGNKEAVDDDQLTEEEKAVQADHQAHGQETVQSWPFKQTQRQAQQQLQHPHPSSQKSTSPKYAITPKSTTPQPLNIWSWSSPATNPTGAM